MTKERKKKPLPRSVPKSVRHGYVLNDKPFRWTLKDCRWAHCGWSDDCVDARYFVEHIINKLQQLETQTWQEILNAAGGKSEGRGNNNHFVAATELPVEERKDFIAMGYMRDFEKVFSLRLSGRERLIGVVDMNLFRVLWYDARHNFF